MPLKDMPIRLREQYMRYSFSGTVPVAGYAWTSFGDWHRITQHVMTRMYDVCDEVARTDPRLAAMEREFTDKMCVNWRDIGYGPLLYDHPLVVRNADQAAALRPRLRNLGLKYAGMIRDAAHTQLDALLHDTTLPIDHGKGSPFWFAGTDRTAAIALARVTDGCASVGEITQKFSSIKPHALPTWLTTMYMRIQSRRKPAEVRMMAGGGVVETTDTRLFARARKITALPFPFNYKIAGIAGVMRWCLKTGTDRNTGTIEIAQKYARMYKYVGAADLSNFDDTVSVETMTAYREEVLVRVCDALVNEGLIPRSLRDWMIEADELIQLMDILGPPAETGEGARIITAEGGIRSGEILTSQKGSDINRERTDLKIMETGFSGKTVNWGDDEVLFTESAGNLTRWMEHEENHGFVETMAPDATFLMRRLPFGYSYLGRMLMGTINREAQRENTHFLQFAVGIRVRRELLRGHPREADYYTILASCPDARIRAATAVARDADLVQLLTASSAGPGNSATRSDALEDALGIGHLTKAERARIEQMLIRVSGHSKLPLRKIAEEGAVMGDDAAWKYLTQPIARRSK